MAPARVNQPRLHREQLRNGLSIVLAPLPESPTVSVWVWYRVGSKNEWPGVTGASHWVEHMLFQGSPKYPKGETDRAVVSVGGTLNAFTDSDFTAYLTTVPREHLEIPLDIESDRMTRALISDPEVDRERTVIYSEREGNENWPEFRVEEELYQLGFRFHPYRWDALGRRDDIQHLTAAELRLYYHRFYGPANAILVIAGGFDLAPTARRVRSLFARIPRGGEDPTVREIEPEPRGERRAVLSGPGTTPYLEIGWRSPALDDPATPATMMIDLFLGGDSRLFSAGPGWGRAPEHPSARLYRALVDTGLAVRASSEWRPRVHPGLFTIHAQAAPKVSLNRLESAIDSTVARLVRTGPTARELSDARDKIRRGAALAYEGASRTAFRLGYFSVLGGTELESRFLRDLLRVSAKEVRDQARSLFQKDHRVVVWYEPTSEAADE